MNPIVVGSIYGAALGGAFGLGIIYWLWSAGQCKKPPIPVKLSDSRDEKRLASATKYIKVICRD